MNSGNHSQDDEKWQALLAHSKPTFTGDTTLPFGFLTSTLAKIKAERREREMLERIGLRSLFAALTVLVAVAGFSVGIQLQSHLELDPEIKSFVQVDDLSIS